MSLFDRMFPPAAAPESPPGTVDGASNYGTPASEVPVPTPGSLLMAIASMPVDPPPALVTQRVKQQLHAAKQDVTTYAQAASEFHLELSDPTKPWDSGPLVFLACIQGRYHLLCSSRLIIPTGCGIHMHVLHIYISKKKKCWCLHHADLSLLSTTNMVPTSETPPLSSTCCLHRTFYGTDHSDKSAPLQMDHNGSISAS